MPRPTMRMRSPFFRCLVIAVDHVAQDGLGLLLGQFLLFGDRRGRCLRVMVVGVAAFFAILALLVV